MEPDYPGVISFAAQLALENIATSDAAYHDVNHTIMVTLVGQEILRGRHISVGAFWCASEGAACEYIPQKRPAEPFQTAQGYVLRGLRLTDKRARSGSPFRLFGTASVGSQSLTGIARLQQLRNDPKFAAVSEVWPFETGWAAKAKWLPAHILVLHAEFYPSVRDSLPDEIKDRGQVRAMWQWARDLDGDNLLWREFCRPKRRSTRGVLMRLRRSR
jgi:hypothetical protein